MGMTRICLPVLPGFSCLVSFLFFCVLVAYSHAVNSKLTGYTCHIIIVIIIIEFL